MLFRSAPKDGAEPPPKFKKGPTQSEKYPDIFPTIGNRVWFSDPPKQMTQTTMVVCEGAFDAVQAASAGYFVASPITKEFPEELIPDFVVAARRAKKVVVCFDNEASGIGNEGALKTCQELETRGVTAHLATLPLPTGKSKMDVAAFVRDQGVAQFQAVIDSASTYLSTLLDLMSGVDHGQAKKALKSYMKVAASRQSDDPIGVLEMGAAVKKAAKITKTQWDALLKEEAKAPKDAAHVQDPDGVQWPHLDLDGLPVRTSAENIRAMLAFEKFTARTNLCTQREETSSSLPGICAATEQDVN